MHVDELSIPALRAGFERGDRSPSEVAEALLARAADVGGPLNAFATLDPEAALESARVATEAFSATRLRGAPAPAPLAGVPLGVKDLFDTAGVQTAYGSPMFAGHVPAADSALVAAAHEAGLVPVGKTATHEFAWGITSEPTGVGPVGNPWDAARVPGGSSGGSGAAVAAGLCSLALGTDTAGSVRIPAALCGVAGFKPTFGLLSADGVFALAPSYDHPGILGRSPADLRTAMAALLAAGGTDPARRPATAPGADEARPLAGLRVGLATHAWAPALDADVGSAVDAAGAALAGLGADLVRLPLDIPADPLPAFAVVQAEEALRVHRDLGLFPARAAEYDPHNRTRLEAAAERSAETVAAARDELAAIRAAVDATLGGVDLALAPVAGCVAPRRGETADLRARVLPFTTLQNVGGLPACAVRAGFGDGLPIGVQVFGPRGSDAHVLDVAAALFDATPAVQAPWPT